MRILVVEDEIKMASFIRRGLVEEHYAVDVAADGVDGIHRAEHEPYDLVILDIMLPGKDGIAICRELRQKRVTVPILLLTARDTVGDKVRGLDAGADDYLAKPFHFEELLARIRSLLRRNKDRKTTVLKIEDLELNQATHHVKRAGREITLTDKEYALLEYLMLHSNEVVTRTMISEHVWNENFDSFTNVIDVYINYLRNKIDKGANPPLIHTIRGSGYTLKGWCA